MLGGIEVSSCTGTLDFVVRILATFVSLCNVNQEFIFITVILINI